MLPVPCTSRFSKIRKVSSQRSRHNLIWHLIWAVQTVKEQWFSLRGRCFVVVRQSFLASPNPKSLLGARTWPPQTRWIKAEDGPLNQSSSTMGHCCRFSSSQLVSKRTHLLKATTCIAQVWTKRIILYQKLTTCPIDVSPLRIPTSRVQSSALAMAHRCNRWRYYTLHYGAQ